MYTKDGNLYSKNAAIDSILTTMNSVVKPSYVDDETLSLYGFKLVTNNAEITLTKEQRKNALSNVDWITSANHLTESTKEKVESWRWLVRNLPEISIKATSIPPLPNLEKKSFCLVDDTLNDTQINSIKNYNTSDSGWLKFLEVWKTLEFTNMTVAVENLLKTYTQITLNEIIGSL